MTTTEGHDMAGPMTDARLTEIRDNESRNLAKLFDSTVTELLAEVDRLRAQVQQYHRSATEHVAKFDRKHEALISAQAEVERLRAELKAAKSTWFENNGDGDVAMHIKAETINELRLNSRNVNTVLPFILRCKR